MPTGTNASGGNTGDLAQPHHLSNTGVRQSTLHPEMEAV